MAGTVERSSRCEGDPQLRVMACFRHPVPLAGRAYIIYRLLDEMLFTRLAMPCRSSRLALKPLGKKKAMYISNALLLYRNLNAGMFTKMCHPLLS